MSTLSQISDRIRKILSLTKSSNPNEAANAASLAQKLMQEHKLSEQDVSDLTDDGNNITEIALGTEGFMASWKFALVTVVSRAFFCEAIALVVKGGTKRKVKIVGRKSDTEIASYVFAYLVKEIDRLAAVDIEEFAEVADSIRAYKDSFRRGAAIGIADKIKNQAEAFAASNEKALAVVKRSQDEAHAFMRNKYGAPRTAEIDMGGKSRDFDEQVGMARGYQAGTSIAIPTSSGEQPRLESKPDPKKPKDVYVKRQKPAEPAVEVTIGLGTDLVQVSCNKCGGVYFSPPTKAADCPACRDNT